MNIIEYLIYKPSNNICPICESSMKYEKIDGYEQRDCNNCDLFCFDKMTGWSHNQIWYKIIYYPQVKEDNEYRILGEFNDQLILYTTIQLKDDRVFYMYDESDDFNYCGAESLRDNILKIKTLKDLYNVGDLALKMMVFK